MKITLIMVTTLDSVISRGNDDPPSNWSSPEDRKFYTSIQSEYDGFIEGWNTYKISSLKRLKKRTTYVVTSREYKRSDDVHVIAVNGTPEAIYSEIKSKGHNNVALIGGASINGQFLKSNLVDEIVITLEPKLFGVGFHLTEGFNLDINLELVDLQKLNDRGTLLLRYKVIK